MSEKEKMLAGEFYRCYDDELVAERKRAREITRLYNNTTDDEADYRAELLKKLFGKIGENSFVEPTLKCDYGYNITVGDWFYANFDCVILDVCSVTIGDHVLFAPRVCLYTATHPVDVATRNLGLEFGKPIVIGDNVWLGGGAIVLPGVTIGDNTVIGAGSVVTKNIPEGVVAAGNPCRIIREI